MVEIVPAVLTDNVSELYEMLSRAEGVAERVQIDIVDGVFSDNKTIDPQALESFDTSLKIDYHLMVKEPINWVERCVRGQADRIIGHIEMMANQVDFVGKVQEVGKYVGLGINLNTPVSKFDSTILTNLDVVLVMSVMAGHGGQEFNIKALDKINKLDEIRVRDDTPFLIQDDGGVSLEYADDVRCAGVDEVIVGNRLFTGDLKQNIDKYKDALYKK